MKRAISFALSCLTAFTLLTFVLAAELSGQDDTPAERLFEELKSEQRAAYEGYHSPAAGKLVKLGSAAIPHLAEGAKSADAYVARWSCHALSEIGEPSIAAFRQLSEQGSLEVRTKALFGLARVRCKTREIAHREVRPIFLAAIKDREPEIRKWAIYGLGWGHFTKDDETVKVIVEALQDPSPVVRSEAALALRVTGDSIAGAHLIAALKDENAGVRADVACALGSRRDKGAIQALMTMRKDPSEKVRYRAVMSLGDLCDLRSVRYLVEWLDDSRVPQATACIGKLIGQDCRSNPSDVAMIREWWRTVGEKRYGNLEIPEIPAKYVNPFYGHKIRQVLPAGWEVLWSDECDAPHGWVRTVQGKPGVQNHLWRPDVRAKTPNGGEYIPHVDVYFMPHQWEGVNSAERKTIKGQTLVDAGEPQQDGAMEMPAARYCGRTETSLLFCSCTELGEWRSAPDELTKAFKAKTGPLIGPFSMFRGMYNVYDLNKQLLAATNQGKTEEVKALLAKGADINALSDYGDTVLARAVIQRVAPELVSFLISKGADVNARTKSGRTALHYAASTCNEPAAEILIRSGADVNAKNDAGFTPLDYALIEVLPRRGESIVPLLQKHGGRSGKPIIRAVEAGDVETVRALIKQGEDVNATMWYGDTALHVASWRGSVEMARLLVASGAEVNARNRSGNSPIYRAAWEGYKEIVELLIGNGARLDTTDERGWTLMHLAADGGHAGIAKLLIEKGVKVDTRDKGGSTPLHRAASQGKEEVAELLIQKGADVNAKNNRGKTPMDEALNQELRDLLHKHGGKCAREIRAY